jgi:hypothetical protein
MYYLGMTEWCKDLYNREDLIDYLRNDDECGPPGSTTLSHGWKEKVVDNPVMQEDARHLALIATADSVPYFKDKLARGGVPFMMRVAQLPAELQLELKNTHLCGILPNEVWESDAEGECRRAVTKNSTLYPMLLAMADELCNLYVNGTRATDTSKPVGHSDRHFTLRVVLLYWSVLARIWCLRSRPVMTVILTGPDRS